MTPSSTASMAARGATWVAMGTLLQRAVHLAAVLALARLLAPEEFGLIAVASMILALVNRLKTLGLHTALVQRQSDTREAADAAFLLNMALTLAIFSGVVALSPLVSGFFGSPRAGLVLAVMSLRLLFDATAAVPAALAVKVLDFRRQALIVLADAVTNALVAVLLAVQGHGVWALVAGSLAGSLVAAGLWWSSTSWRPRLRLDRRITAELMGFGVRIWSAGNLSYLIDASSRALVGRIMGLATLGYYEITSRVVHTPVQQLAILGERVAVPAFCREQDDRDTLRRWYLRLTGYLLILTAAAAGCLALFADHLIPVLFGEQWLPAVDPARALAAYALLVPLLHGWAAFVATGEVHLLLRLTAVRVAVTLALLWAAAHVSLVAVCAAESVAACLFAPLYVALVARMLGIRARQIAAMLAAPLAGLTALVLVGNTVRQVAADLVQEPTLGSLLLLAVPGLIAYGLVVLVVRPGLLSEARDTITLVVGAREAQPAAQPPITE